LKLPQGITRIKPSLFDGSIVLDNKNNSFRIYFTLFIFLLIFNSDLGNYDRQATQDLLKDIAQTQQIAPDARHRFKGILYE